MPIKDLVKRRENHNRYMRDVWYPNNKKKHIKFVSVATKKRREETSKIITSLKVSCLRCPENDPICLDFHHKNPKDKIITISAALHSQGWSLKRILKEISKCDVLCANCHRKEHNKAG